MPDVALYLDEELKPEFNDQTEFLTLLMNSSDSAEAVAVVKAISAAFMDQIVYAETRTRAQHLTDLEKVYGETSDDLRKKKADLKKLADSLGTTDKESLTQQQMQLIESSRDARNARNQISGELFKTQANLDTFKSRLESLKRTPVPALDLEAALDIDLEYKKLTERLKPIETLVNDFGENSKEPTAIRARKKVVDLKQLLETAPGRSGSEAQAQNRETRPQRIGTGMRSAGKTGRSSPGRAGSP